VGLVNVPSVPGFPRFRRSQNPALHPATCPPFANSAKSGGRVARPLTVYATTTVGAPLLRFWQGRVPRTHGASLATGECAHYFVTKKRTLAQIATLSAWQQGARRSLFEHLHHGGSSCGLRFADQQVDMLAHHDVSHDDEAVTCWNGKENQYQRMGHPPSRLLVFFSLLGCCRGRRIKILH
jgi:hypothetical protein